MPFPASEVSRGTSISEFENGFAQFMGGGEAVSTSKGTAALELAVRGITFRISRVPTYLRQTRNPHHANCAFALLGFSALNCVATSLLFRDVGAHLISYVLTN